jgi:hypothetical protein
MIADIRGKLQNGVYSVAKGGVHYVKNIPASVYNPCSADQGLARSYLQEATKDWAGLTSNEKTMWENVAARCAGLAKTNGGGQLALVPAIGFDGSGFNAYCAFRTRARLASHSLVNFNTAWRLGVDTEDQPTDQTLTDLSCAAGTLTLTVTAPVTSDVAALTPYWIRSMDGTYHKQVFFLNDIATLIQNTTSAKSKHGTSLLFSIAVGAVVAVQTQVVNPSGWASPGSNTRIVTLA